MTPSNDIKKQPAYKKFAAIYEVLASLYVHRYQFVIEAEGSTALGFLPDTLRDALLFQLAQIPARIEGKSVNVFDAMQNGWFIDNKDLRTAQNKDRKGYSLSYLQHNLKQTEPGTRIVFNLVLTGNHNKFAGQWITAVQEMCRQGFGTDKATFNIVNVSESGFASDPVTIDFQNALKIKPARPIHFHDFLSFSSEKEYLNIDFKSPTNFGDSELSAGISFREMIVKSLSRFLDLAAFYCGADESKYREAADMIPSFCADTRLQLHQQFTKWKYFSFPANRGKDMRTISGCTGNIVWKGKFNRYLPILKMGEILQTGDNITHGSGVYRIID